MTMKKFWNMIASHLNKKEYNVTPSQCKSKMTNLKKTYKNVKDHNEKSGNNHKIWRYFDVNIEKITNMLYVSIIHNTLIPIFFIFQIMDEMFNTKPWMTPILTLDSSNPTTLPSPDYDSENNSNKKDSSSDKAKMRSTRKYFYQYFIPFSAK